MAARMGIGLSALPLLGVATDTVLSDGSSPELGTMPGSVAV